MSAEKGHAPCPPWCAEHFTDDPRTSRFASEAGRVHHGEKRVLDLPAITDRFAKRDPEQVRIHVNAYALEGYELPEPYVAIGIYGPEPHPMDGEPTDLTPREARELARLLLTAAAEADGVAAFVALIPSSDDAEATAYKVEGP